MVNDGNDVDILNNYLSQGWKVVNTWPMPSSCAITGEYHNTIKINPTCLVIIEKE